LASKIFSMRRWEPIPDAISQSGKGETVSKLAIVFRELRFPKLFIYLIKYITATYKPLAAGIIVPAALIQGF
jgi:hypothetical protein